MPEEDDIINLFNAAVDQQAGAEISAAIQEIQAIQKRYSQKSYINEGGMKRIFSCTDHITERNIAKAVLQDNESIESIEHFIYEAKLTSSLEHPNIVPVYDIGIEDNKPYFIMKKLGGMNLKELFDRLKNEKELSKKYPLSKLLLIFLKICDAISYAHSKGIIHRDLKPSNIQIDEYGEVAVCDWGVAKILGTLDQPTTEEERIDHKIAQTMNGYIKGSPGYMAPEQILPKLGELSPRTDIFGLGSILYTMLTLEAPFKGETLEKVISKTVNNEYTQPKEIVKNCPESLNAVCVKSMQKSPADRYSSVKELASDINAYLEGKATIAENASFLKLITLLFLRNKVLFTSIASLVLIIVIITLTFLIRLQTEKELVVEARDNEKVAKIKAIDLLDENEKIRYGTANEIMSLGLKLYNAGFYGTARENFGHALKLNADLSEAKYYILICLIGEFRFSEARNFLKTFNKANDYPLKKIKFILDTVKDKELDVPEAWGLAENFLKMKEHEHKNITKIMIATMYKKYDLKERIYFADKYFKRMNPGCKVFYQGNKLMAQLNFKEVTNIYALKNLPVNILNLENSSVRSLNELRNSPLEILNLNNCKVRGLVFYSLFNLKELHLKNTKTALDFKLLTSHPLTVLTLGNIPTDLRSLNSLENLKEVRLPKKLYEFPKMTLEGVDFIYY